MTRSNLSPEFLERCEQITKAFEKKDGVWSINSQLLNIYEECMQVQLACKNNDIENIKEEVCDLILSSLTLLHKLDVTPKQIQEAMKQTLHKVELKSELRGLHFES